MLSEHAGFSFVYPDNRKNNEKEIKHKDIL
jgi:hypothetical protein